MPLRQEQKLLCATRPDDDAGDLPSRVGQYVWGSVTDKSAVFLEFYLRGDDWPRTAQPWRIIKIEAKK